MAISDAVMVLSKCHRAASQAMGLGGKNLVSERSEVLFFCFWGNFKMVFKGLMTARMLQKMQRPLFLFPAKAAYFHAAGLKIGDNGHRKRGGQYGLWLSIPDAAAGYAELL